MDTLSAPHLGSAWFPDDVFHGDPQLGTVHLGSLSVLESRDLNASNKNHEPSKIIKKQETVKST